MCLIIAENISFESKKILVFGVFVFFASPFASSYDPSSGDTYETFYMMRVHLDPNLTDYVWNDYFREVGIFIKENTKEGSVVAAERYSFNIEFYSGRKTTESYVYNYSVSRKLVESADAVVLNKEYKLPLSSEEQEQEIVNYTHNNFRLVNTIKPHDGNVIEVFLK